MKREIYLDYAKALACLAVVVQHSCNLSADVRAKYTAAYIFYFLCRFAVPVFILTTGCLMLDDRRELSFKNIFLKYIPRILIPFIVVVYAINIRAAIDSGSVGSSLIPDPLKSILFVQTNTAFWYCYMIIGLYLIMPFVKKMVSACTKRELEVFLIMFFVFRIVLQYLKFIPKLRLLPEFLGTIAPVVFNGYVDGYLGYLILGYYIKKYVPNVTKKMSASALVVLVMSLALPLCIFLTSGENYRAVGTRCADVFSPSVLLTSVSLIILLRGIFQNNERRHRLAVEISRVSFEIYLLHVYVLQLLKYWQVPKLGSTAADIALKSVFVFTVSFAAAFIIGKIKKLFKKKRCLPK